MKALWYRQSKNGKNEMNPLVKNVSFGVSDLKLFLWKFCERQISYIALRLQLRRIRVEILESSSYYRLAGPYWANKKLKLISMRL